MLRNRVREFRELHGLSQDDLAERAGVSPRLIALVEGQPGYTPSSRIMIALCNYFNVDLGRLFWIDRSTPTPATEEGEAEGEKSDAA